MQLQENKVEKISEFCGLTLLMCITVPTVVLKLRLGQILKQIQYLMGYSDISVTMNVYTHIGFDNAEEKHKQMKEFRKV